MECLSYCIASAIDLTGLDNSFKKNVKAYFSSKYRDNLKMNLGKDRCIFVFKNGTIVSWGIKRFEMDIYLELMRPFVERPVLFIVRDSFSYRIGDKTTIKPHDFFEVDCLTLDGDNDEVKLSLSYGFSQSVKLQYFETMIEALIEKYTPIIQRLSSDGKVDLSYARIRQIIGEILTAKSEMNLTSNFLYHPKYFWQHPTLEEYYSMLERYLHVQRRINAINHRLNTLTEIFEMFNSYLENKHSHNLEIIIIVLIALEIIFAVLNIHF